MMLYPAATIIRHSALYGYDVASPPAEVDGKDKRSHLRLADSSAMTPTFIAEFAFLLARNILYAPTSLNESPIHVATKEDPITWYDFLTAANVTVTPTWPTEDSRMGQHRGLVATPGWFLPSRKEHAQWRNFEVERNTHRPTRFWVSEGVVE